MRAAVFAVLLATAAASPLSAQETVELDPRIQTFEYDPNKIVLLSGTLGYQFMLELDPAERIETVSIGDSLGWQVTPNRRANVLFLKPIDRASRTNLTVLTDARRYTFELQVAPANSSAPVLYIARMVYAEPAVAALEPAPPPAAPQAEAPPVVVNGDYGVTGSADIRPVRVFDDGEVTYFEWSKDASTPAIFAQAADGTESVVNYVVREPYTIVDQLSPRFVLRNGAQVATVVNQNLAANTGDGR